MSIDKAFEIVPPGKVEPLGPGVLSFIPLRAYLAAHAPEAVFTEVVQMTGDEFREEFDADATYPGIVAKLAVEYADALLAELAKEAQGG